MSPLLLALLSSKKGRFQSRVHTIGLDGPGKALLESSRGKGWTYHCLVPDNSHPLFYAIDALGDQSEVVLAHSLLSSTVGTVATTCDL